MGDIDMASSAAGSAVADPRTGFKSWFHREPTLARFTLGVFALIPLLLIAAAIDERTLNGINIWIKPLKFNVAIVLYLGTLTWYAGWVDTKTKSQRWYRVYSWILCGTLFLMLPWLYGSAAVGELAHYNRTHPVLAPLYSLMGVVSVVFTTGALAFALLIAGNKRSTLPAHFKHAVVWSLLISFFFTVILAGELASMESHWIGGTESDANGLWPFGWSRDGGDLRVAHFFSLHAMHFIPLAALLLPEKLAALPRLSAAAISVVYAGFVLFVYFQAKQAQPFLGWLA